MSHFTVLVAGTDLDEALAPFQENNMGDCPEVYLRYKAYPRDSNKSQWFDNEEHAKQELGDQFDPENAYTENPNAKWDWFVVGGRWSNSLLLKSGKKVDSALKGDIDFESIRKKSADTAGKRYDQVQAVIAGRAIPVWDTIREKHGADIDSARQEYNSHQVIQDTRKLLGIFEDLTEFDCPRDTYTQRAAASANTTHALLIDGQWYERGRMMMFAAVDNEKPETDWNTEFDQLLEALPDDTLLTMVDCHI